MATSEEIAWAAGLFEGEGCCRALGVNSVELTVTSTDSDVLARFMDVVGVGTVHVVRRSNPERDHHKQVYAWKITASQEVRRILMLFRPWLGTRRGKKADEMLDRLKSNRGWNGDKTHCVRGHLYFGPNLFVTRGGKRQCRECRKVHKRRAWARKRAVA